MTIIYHYAHPTSSAPLARRVAVPMSAQAGDTVTAATAATAASAATAAQGPRYIPISPYPDHLLDLDTLDPQTRLMARALSVFEKVRDDYATAPYPASFNLSAVVDRLRSLVADEKHVWHRTHFFVVGFRSQIPPSTNYGDLGRLDEAAHREALAGGGLLRYWFHEPDADGRNLATCVWRSQDEARKAGHGKQHQRASSSARSMYTEWKIERYRLDIFDDVSHWEIVEWKE